MQKPTQDLEEGGAFNIQLLKLFTALLSGNQPLNSSSYLEAQRFTYWINRFFDSPIGLLHLHSLATCSLVCFWQKQVYGTILWRQQAGSL